MAKLSNPLNKGSICFFFFFFFLKRRTSLEFCLRLFGLSGIPNDGLLDVDKDAPLLSLFKKKC
eukprot:UN28300